MKDPKVTELVKQFDKDVKALNKTWGALQRNGVYVRLNVLGQSTYESPKYIEVDQITQHVEYMKEEK